MEEQQHGVTTGTLAPDVAREVERLREADLLVLTAPMWWFSVPAMLKGWFDRVLVNGYAYGTVKAWSGPLTGKRSLLAMTCSYEQAGFRAGGSIGELEPLLRPIQQGTLAYCGFQVLEPFMAYAADEVDDGARASMLESFRSALRLAVERCVKRDPLPAAIPDLHRVRGLTCRVDRLHPLSPPGGDDIRVAVLPGFVTRLGDPPVS